MHKKKFVCPKCGFDMFRVYKVLETKAPDDPDADMYGVGYIHIVVECLHCGLQQVFKGEMKRIDFAVAEFF